MTRRSLIAALALSGALLVTRGSAAPPDEAPDLSGTWQCAGWNPGEDPEGEPSYRITVTLEKRPGESGVYLVTWNLADGGKNVGVGLYDARTKGFAASYSVGRKLGVGVWTISADRKTMECVGTNQHIDARGVVAYEAWTRS